MKTTIDIPDPLFRQVKVRAALKAQTMKAFVLEAILDKLQAEAAARDSQSGWRSVFGKATAGSVEEIQAVIDAEFSQLDPEDWK